VKVLLDTQIFLWMQAEPERFGTEARKLLEDGRDHLPVSAASSWEIANKHRLGKLVLPEDPQQYVPKRMRSSGVTPLPIEHSHALAVGALPHHHRDPFDRLLVVQAQAEKVSVMTTDPVFAAYDVELVSA
jgi:PIN domain nuclease of toxin-antitoxin system